MLETHGVRIVGERYFVEIEYFKSTILYLAQNGSETKVLRGELTSKNFPKYK